MVKVLSCLGYRTIFTELKSVNFFQIVIFFLLGRKRINYEEIQHAVFCRIYQTRTVKQTQKIR